MRSLARGSKVPSGESVRDISLGGLRVRTFRSETFVPAPVDKVFEFFSQAENLERLSPPSLRFEILTPQPIEMRPGALIDYRLRLLGVPFRWQSEIVVWEPGVRFVDVQTRGPYPLWEHEHAFEAVEGGTIVHDGLRYAAPGGPLEPVLHSLFVHRQIERIFAYRERRIREIFGTTEPA